MLGMFHEHWRSLVFTFTHRQGPKFLILCFPYLIELKELNLVMSQLRSITTITLPGTVTVSRLM